MIGEVSIRTATRDDAAAVHQLIGQLAASLDTRDSHGSTVDDYVRAMSTDNPDFYALIAEHGNDAVGLIVFFLTYSTWRGSRGIYIQDLFVTDGARGSGTGRRLVGEVVRWGKERHATHIRLSVDADNLVAQAFYGRIGLSWRQDQRTFEADGERFEVLGAGG